MSKKESPTKRSPSPSPTVTLDVLSKKDLQRSSSEESIRVLHHAVLFPSSPNLNRVTYIRRTLESDAELIRRQQVMIALQPLTFSEELAAKRKQLEMRAEKRKRDKAAATEAKEKAISVPEINVVPASGKITPVPASPTKMKAVKAGAIKEKAKLAKPVLTSYNSRQQQRAKQASPSSVLGQMNNRQEKLVA